jgi:hypothetical protein
MATVGISEKLLSSVRLAISRMQQADVRSRVPDNYDKVKVDASVLVNMSIWGEHYHLKDTLPDSWLEKTRTFNWDVPVPKGRFPSDHTFRISFTGLTACVMRPRLNSYYPVTVPYNDLFSSALANQYGMAEVREALEYCMQVAEISAHWDKIQLDVERFLKTRRSLNEALKQMPSLSMYIPKEYMERVEAKVVRQSGQSDVNLSEDRIQELTAAAVSARLAGAAVA